MRRSNRHAQHTARIRSPRGIGSGHRAPPFGAVFPREHRLKLYHSLSCRLIPSDQPSSASMLLLLSCSIAESARAERTGSPCTGESQSARRSHRMMAPHRRHFPYAPEQGNQGSVLHFVLLSPLICDPFADTDLRMENPAKPVFMRVGWRRMRRFESSKKSPQYYPESAVLPLHHEALNKLPL
jgi:hypothetical protein